MCNVCAIGIPPKEKKRLMFKKKNCEKNDWNFWDLGKDINSQWQEVEQTLNSRNSKKITHSYIKIKLLKAKDKKKSKEEWHATQRGIINDMTLYLSPEIMEARW